MIRVHCDHLADFLRIYVFERHVLPALLIPLVFTLVFPVYWFVICPAIWAAYPEGLMRPRSWLVGYWLTASVLWFISLAVCLCHMTSQSKEHSPRIWGICGSSGGGMAGSPAASRTQYNSTEDLWNEDGYIPDPLPYLPSPPPPDIRVSGIQPVTYAASVSASQSIVDAEPRREIDETWDYDYESDRVARPGGCTEGGHPAPPDSPFVVNPCHDVGVVEGGGSMLQNEDVRIYHTNLLRSQMTPVNNRGGGGSRSEFPPCNGRSSLPASPFATCSKSFTFPNPQLNPHPSHPASRGTSFSSARRLSGTLPHNQPGFRRLGRSGPIKANMSRGSSQSLRYPPGLRRGGGGGGRQTRSRPPQSKPPTPFPCSQQRPLTVSTPRLSQPIHSVTPTKPQLSQSVPKMSINSQATEDSSSLTDAEMRSIRDVCTGRIERKDSIVSDSKFDTLIASLQSLASEIEKDFVEQNLTDFASERAKAEPTATSSSSVPVINVEEHGEG